MSGEAAARQVKVKREGNSASAIYDRVRADIMNGRLVPGSPLSQLALAKTHGTSRGPVREALHRLQQDQLITGSANKRFNVAQIELADLESALILQLANVTLAIRVSVPRLGPPSYGVLDAAVGRMEAAREGDTAAWEAAYRDFALTICSEAGDQVIALIAGLIDSIQRFRVNLLDRFPRVYAGAEDFRRIALAARDHDSRAAAELFAKFFGRLSSLILAGVAPRHDAVRLR
ncbi:GntR family transcriptional regulator, partial [uncultured Sphingomonas sp.]|uniref:GntR family transcriptional regulator n=1 Tax=uncultured Sphingomonas sp. TaxID=158754 RepID=UPI0035CBC828